MSMTLCEFHRFPVTPLILSERSDPRHQVFLCSPGEGFRVLVSFVICLWVDVPFHSFISPPKIV